MGWGRIGVIWEEGVFFVLGWFVGVMGDFLGERDWEGRETYRSQYCV